MDKLPQTRLFPTGDPRIGSDQGTDRVKYAADLIRILTEMYEDISQKLNEVIDASIPSGSSPLPQIFDPTGDGKIELFCCNAMITSLANRSTPTSRITCADCVFSIHGGVAPYTYYMKRSGGAYGTGQLDPKDAYIDLVCADVGFVTLVIKVEDANGIFNECEVAAVIQDIQGYCP